MGILRKRGVETIDYTLLQKKGFIKKPEEKKMPFKVNSQGLIDFTPIGNSVPKENFAPTSATQSSTSDPISPFNFLDNLARRASSTSDTSSTATTLSNTPIDNAEISTLRIKIDDLEYKLSQLIDKLSSIEIKMGDFEKKVFN